MTDELTTTELDHFQAEVERLTYQYYDQGAGVPAWILAVRLESIAEDIQREANE